MKNFKLILIAVTFAFLTTGYSFSKVEPSKEALSLQNNFRDISKQVSPAVVYIWVEKKVKISQNSGNQWGFNIPDFKRFFGNPDDNNGDDEDNNYKRKPSEQKMGGLGSGMIVTGDGYVLTNYHVIEDAIKVRVTLTNEKSYDAEIKGYDVRHDIAVIKIKSNDKFPVVELGDSESVQVGDIVVAVGNPFGYANTVTMGIVSARGRLFDDMDIQGIPKRIPNIIQTDAPINPGNSGGPLLNLEGQVIGINMAIAGAFSSGNAGNVGLGFAIPINDAKSKLSELIGGKKTKGETPWVGVSLQDLDDSLAKKLKVENGVLIPSVEDKGPAKAAGFKDGDIIIKIDNVDVKSAKQVVGLIANHEVGDSVTFVLNRDGKEKEIKIVLAPWGEKTATLKASSDEKENVNETIGITVKNLSDSLSKKYGIKDGTGVVVTDVEKGSLAEKAGIEEGDLIKQIEHKEITDKDDFNKAVSSGDLKDGILMLVQKGDASSYIVLSEANK